ncbi:histidinol-phosphatase [Odoribacter lunatus]|uniref:histidinol-phosphatase n=1 Tax=Odoribacter lunatus TaxID=2941335 RepID=UPI00203A87A6|nr:histidinol-phosphatase [Odoribacter lunatus]
MTNATNYHSHCSFCDGNAPMEEFVKAAIEAGFIAYGFSSHAPLPFSARWTLAREEMPAYLAEFERLKREYEGKIELYVGLEIDYLNEASNPASVYFQQLPLDFRIGSVHLVYAPDGEIVDTDTGAENFKRLVDANFHGDLKALVGAYFEASMRMLEKGGFDIIGHTNKVWYNAEQCETGVTDSAWYQAKLADLFALIAETGAMVEINTKYFHRNGSFFPNVKDWKYIKRWNLPIVVNSDVHFPELVNAGRSEALKLLKEAGFRTVRQLMGGKWQEVEIG